MGLETLPDSTTIAAGLVIQAADFLTTNGALQGAFVGRSTSGVPASSQSLGTALYPWGNAYITNLIANGSSIDFSGIVAQPNRIVSGKTRTTSGQPYFLDPDGAAATVTILAAATDLIVDINGTLVTISADIVETGLTAAPGTNNTCAINDTNFADQPESKYFGEIDSDYPTITIDTVGSNITSKVGQMIALKTGTSEIMFGWLKSTTEFTSVKRGFFFDSSNNPIVRETIADNDTLTLMNTGWIFITNDGSTVDVSYLTPVYSFDSPGSPATGQYWYDLTNNVWKRYSGSDFVTVNRMLLGIAIIDSSNCIAARSFDFYQDFKADNTIDLEVFSDEVVRTKAVESWVNIYGTERRYHNSMVEFDNTADMETGSVAASTRYYLYLSTDGEPYISTERPYDRTGDLRGKYHPYNNWLSVGRADTDTTSDWLSCVSDYYLENADTAVDFSAKNLKIDVASSTTVTVTADEIILVNDDGKTCKIEDVNQTFNTATDIHAGTEKASHDYDMNLSVKNPGGSVIRKMAARYEGTADGTTAGYLDDSTHTLKTDGYKRGDPIYNTADLTKTTLAEDPSADGADVLLNDDIMASGETYIVKSLKPTNSGEFRANISAAVNNASSNLVDMYYTQIQEEKQYLGDGTDFNVTSSPAVVSLRGTRGTVRQVNDWTGKGLWKFNFNFAYSVANAARSTLICTVSGISLDTVDANFVQAMSGGSTTNGASISYFYGTPGTGNFSIHHTSTTTSSYQLSGDVYLDKKPTFHT